MLAGPGFPSIGLASIYTDNHFDPMQINQAMNFKQIHQYLFVYGFDDPLMIFPSFHVLLAAITIFIYRKTPALFFIPVLLFNLDP